MPRPRTDAMRDQSQPSTGTVTGAFTDVSVAVYVPDSVKTGYVEKDVSIAKRLGTNLESHHHHQHLDTRLETYVEQLLPKNFPENGTNGSLFFSENGTYNDSELVTVPNDYGEKEQFDKAFREAQVAIIVLYTVLCVVAVLGNSCAVYVVISKRKMRNVTNYFIASLAVSDILMAVVCIPFSFVANVLLDHWPFGSTLCPIVMYLQVAVVFQNAYTLLAMSLERYIAIMHPFLRRLGKRRCLQIVALCWVLAFLTPIPTAVTSRVEPMQFGENNETRDICFEHWGSETQRFSYSLTIMVLQYFVPLLVLIYTYAKIVHVIWLKDLPTPAELLNPNEKEKEAKPKDTAVDPRKKIIKMMLTVVGIYGICWLPLHAITIAFDVDNSVYDAAYMRVVWIASHWLAMSSCAYNPFIYWWMNPKFREGYSSVFSRMRSYLCCCVCSSSSDGKDFVPSSDNRRCIFKCGNNGSSNLCASRRQSATQMVEFTGVSCDVTRADLAREKVMAKEHHALSNISEVAENGTSFNSSKRFNMSNGNDDETPFSHSLHA
ncbi:RYamide receptor isoform X2 [Aplysia californica]|uniref:RYamide receptor isoform X2 n=1 Tax=Aplysia californica TaxID=6500 RepID=A0ABM1VT29_APLCA|nr:RYamide receptor isoform X2 [Aplysia californica]